MTTARRRIVWVVQGDYRYGDGWEDLISLDSRTEAREELRARKENESGKFRVICRQQPLPLVLF